MTTDLGNYDAQAELLSALRNDEELATLSKGGFHNLVAKQDAPFPRIVYSQLNNRPTVYADGEEVRATVNFQVSIFTDSESIIHEKAMIKAVDRIMKSLEYGKYDHQPLFETDTKLYHVALRYEKNFYGDDE
ncbi:tail completion protein gp17 [Oceanobacillus indicireducens]|uniref:DUF3168 domain-containing protein n=1 Tax=Oceanobacillus indicireducens TaxID=1004261 RepID=A0A918D2G4_9BACI|nr:DUF3168 domain-containing protein [Oceanobacillus indicireducens]GGN59317.1 hypothetical protein GCM10007971_22310 [Oceanobacillus indicireducens]